MAEIIIQKFQQEGLDNFVKELIDVSNGLKAMDKDVVDVKTDLGNLGKAVDLAKQKLSTLKEGTKEFSDLKKEIQAAEIATSNFAENTDTMKKQLRDTIVAVQFMSVKLKEMEKAGLSGTNAYKVMSDEFKKAKEKAGELKDSIGDLNAETAQLGSDTKGVDHFIRTLDIGVSAIGAIEGAQVLFGVESENTQKVIARLNAVMVISNSLKQIQEELNKEDTKLTFLAAGAKKVYALAVGTSTGAMKLFRIALAATGIGLIVIALAALIANFDKVTKKVQELVPSLGNLGEKFGDLKRKGIAALDALFSVMVNGAKIAFNVLTGQFGKAADIFKKAGKDAKDAFNKELNQQNKSENEKRINALLENGLAGTPEQARKQAQRLVQIYAGKLKDPESIKVLNDAIKQLNEKAIEGAPKEVKVKTKVIIDVTEFNLDIFNKRISALENEIEKIIIADIELGVDPKTDEQLIELVNSLKQLKLNVEEVNKVKISLSAELTVEELKGKDLTTAILDLAKKEIEKPQREVEPLTQKIKINVEPEINTDNYRAKSLFNRLLGIDSNSTPEEKASSIFGTIGGIVSDFSDLALRASEVRANKEISLLEKQKEKGLISEKKYQRELAKIKNEQARKQHRADVLNAFLAVPLAVLQGLKTGGPILAAVAGAIALTNATLVASSEVPQFKVGTKKAPSGFKWVGEEGPELINDKGGYAIIPHEESKQVASILNKWEIPNRKADTFKMIKDTRPMNISNFPSSIFGNINVSDLLGKKMDRMTSELDFIGQYIKQGNSERRHGNNKLLATLENSKNGRI